MTATKIRFAWRVLLMISGLVVLIGGCGSSGSSLLSGTSSDTSDAADAVTEPAMAFDEPASGDAASNEMVESIQTTAGSADGSADAEGADLGGGAVPAAQAQPIDLGRDIIFTAQVEVAVPDIAQASVEAGQVMARFGGLLFGQNTTTNERPRSILTFKVQPQDFQAALAALGEIGDIRNQTVSADDVTERVVDLESRISTAEASVTRLRGFLEGADDLETIASLEAQLLDRETRLETLKGQLRTVRDQVDLATITLTLVETLSQPAVRLTLTSYPGDDDGLSCPGNFDSSRIDEGDVMVICYEITNVGDTPLTDLTLRDPVIDIDGIDELTVVLGDPDDVMEPGQSVTLAYSRVTNRSLQLKTRVTALPVNEAGAAVENRLVADTQSHFLEAVDPGGIPSFTDGLAASWDLLKNLVRVAILVLGAIIPFIWLVAVAWFLHRWWQRRRARQRNESERLVAEAAQRRDEQLASMPPPPSTEPQPDPDPEPVA